MMARLVNMVLFSYILAMCGCLPLEEPRTHETLSLWTDMPDSLLVDKYWVINSSLVQPISSLNSDHDCMDSLLLRVNVPFDQLTTFAIGDELGNTERLLADITVHKAGSGINIKRHQNSTVHIDGQSDLSCTQLYFSW